jgi:hypothetical protein
MDLVQADQPFELGGKGKKISRKWTEEEVVLLAQSITRVCGAGPPDGHHSMNWAEIAKAVPGRTGKQCREKYKVRSLRVRAGLCVWVTLDQAEEPSSPAG